MLSIYNKYGQLKVVTSTSSTGVSSVSGVSPITSTGGSNPIISTLITTNKLLGRHSASTGVMEEIVIGTGLSLVGNTLTSTGSFTPKALTKINDTNVTLTLGGTPGSALLQDVSLTLGWIGTLADSRIASASTWNTKQNALSGIGFVKISGTTITYDNNSYYLASNPSGFIDSSALSPYLLSSTASSTYFPIPIGTISQYIDGTGALQSFPAIPTITPSALTKTDDTNITLTLSGTPATALLEAVGIAVGWTGTLADSRIASASNWNSKEPAIAAGTTLQYWRGDKTWQTFPTIPTVGTWGALNYPTWVSGTPFVKMTAAGTFALDTNTYLTGITSSDVTTALGYTPVTNARTITINGVTYDLTADRSWTIAASGGTVTSVAALTLGTTGTDLSSTVANPTTTPVITLNVPTASATNRGALSSTDWSRFDTAYTDRLKWDGGSTGLVAATGRTSLGATTVGGNLFTLTNPSAITFIRINADNSISTLDAASFVTAIGITSSQWTTLGSDIYYNGGVVAIGSTPVSTSKFNITDTVLAGSGSLAGSVLNLSQTWNTTGIPTAIKLNVTNTASSVLSLLADLQVGGASKFNVRYNGDTTTPATSFAGSFTATYGYSLANTQLNFTQTWDNYTLGGSLVGSTGSFDQNGFWYKKTINQTGTSTGISRGLYINPILTSVVDFRAIESTNGKVILTDTISAGSGSLTGSLLDLKQTWNTTGNPVAIKLNVTNTASGGGAYLADLQVGGSSKFRVDASGTVNGTGTVTAQGFLTQVGYQIIGGTQSFTSLTQQFYCGATIAGSSGAIDNNGFYYNKTINQTGTSTAITRGLYINPTLTAVVDFRAIEVVAGKLVFSSTITATGTTGAQTINKISGKVNAAAGTTSLVVTNSLVTTSSIVFCQMGTNDATARITSVVEANGSFTINYIAPTAETVIKFKVIN